MLSEPESCFSHSHSSPCHECSSRMVLAGVRKHGEQTQIPFLFVTGSDTLYCQPIPLLSGIESGANVHVHLSGASIHIGRGRIQCLIQFARGKPSLCRERA